MHIADNPNNLTPIVDAGNSNALAECLGGLAPIFKGEILGDECDRNSVVCIRPTDVTSRDERYAQGSQISRRDEQEMPKRRNRSLGVCAVCREHIIEAAVSIQAHCA